MTVQMEKNGNYNLTFEIYPGGEMNQKIELMAMAGGSDMPDVFMGGGFPMASIKRYGQAGMIIPVNTYYQNSAHFINESLKEVDYDVFRYITSDDGNIYGLFGVHISVNLQFSGSRFMIFEPWLDALGLAMPKTIDEYTNVLKAFRDRDPNGNGQRDEIPLLGERAVMGDSYFRIMMTPFIYSQPDFWISDSNSRLDVAFNKPQWREGTRYTKMLIDEGLLSPLSFTQDGTQMTALINPQPSKVGSFIRNSASNLGATDIRRVQYIGLHPLEGPAGRQQVWLPNLPNIRMLITSKCKTPESAFMLGDYMCGEEMSVGTRFGEKGVDWVTPPAGSVSWLDSIGIPALLQPISIWGVMQNKWWGQTGPYILPGKWEGEVPGNEFAHIIAIGRTIGPQIQYTLNKNPVVGLVYTEKEQEVITEFHPTILSYVRESFARFVTGDLNIDRDWDAYLAEFSKMGLTEVIGAAQSAWTRMNR